MAIVIGIFSGILVVASFIILLQFKAIRDLGSKVSECNKMLMSAAAVMARMAQKQGIDIPNPPTVPTQDNPIRTI